MADATANSGGSSISAVVLARDAEGHLSECLDLLRWADEIVVIVDAASTDRTREIASEFTERTFIRPFASFPDQRNMGLELARGEWVLFVDADERLSPALAAEVVNAARSPEDCVGFWIPRENYICGRVVRHAGWWPDPQLRLVRRGHARYDPDQLVHELPMLDGPAGRLKEPLVHYNYRSLREFRARQAHYAVLEARRLLRQGYSATLRSCFGRPLREFWWRWIGLEGYREGWLGLALSAVMGYAALCAQLELIRLSRRNLREIRATSNSDL